MHEPVKCAADFDYTGGSFVDAKREVEAILTGVLDAPIAPGSPRTAYWPCSACVNSNTHAKYASNH